jgi:hypothetical protein
LGELIARGRVSDYSIENQAMVSGTLFDFLEYTKGGALSMKAIEDNDMAMHCTLCLLR